MFKLLFLFGLIIPNFHLVAQHNHMNNNQQDTVKMDSTMKMDMKIDMKMDSSMKMNSSEMNNNKPGKDKMQMQMNMSMNGAVLLTDEMEREGSGTSWMPASSSMQMKMYHSNGWMFMVHGAITLRYTKQGGPRGADAFSAPNWFMASAQTRPGKYTQIMFRTMLSLDAITDGGYGYPLLFQTGETWNGKALIDRQHPHDLFAELSTSLSAQFSRSLSGHLYIGYPGEPALGPVVFMHRPSALSNPDATLSHHWQDATHITFGVVTGGIAVNSKIKLEGSVFNGTEPDENRFDFDKPKLNSYSGRVSYNPWDNISLQVSAGFVKNPESDGVDVTRRTASALYSREINSKSRIDVSLIWGQNKDGRAGAQNSFIEEAEYYISGNSIYTRIENVEKTRGELGIEDRKSDKEFIGAYTLGYKRKILNFAGLDLNAGLQGTIYSVPSDIQIYYGKNPVSYQVYLSVMPGRN
jgi:hypothetical protein